MELTPDRMLDQAMIPVPPMDSPIDEPSMGVTAALFALLLAAMPAGLGLPGTWPPLLALAGGAVVAAVPYVRNRIRPLDLTASTAALVTLALVAAGLAGSELAEVAGLFLMLMAMGGVVATRAYAPVLGMLANLQRSQEANPEGRPLEAVLTEALGAAPAVDVLALLEQRRAADREELIAAARGYSPFRPARVLRGRLLRRLLPDLHPADATSAAASLSGAATWIAYAQAQRHGLSDRQFVRLADGYRRQIAAVLADHVPQRAAEPA